MRRSRLALQALRITLPKYVIRFGPLGQGDERADALAALDCTFVLQCAQRLANGDAANLVLRAQFALAGQLVARTKLGADEVPQRDVEPNVEWFGLEGGATG